MANYLSAFDMDPMSSATSQDNGALSNLLWSDVWIHAQVDSPGNGMDSDSGSSSSISSRALGGQEPDQPGAPALLRSSSSSRSSSEQDSVSHSLSSISPLPADAASERQALFGSPGAWTEEAARAAGGPFSTHPLLLQADDRLEAAWNIAPDRRAFDGIAAEIAREQAAQLEREERECAVELLLGPDDSRPLAVAPLLPPSSFISPPRFTPDGALLPSEAERLQAERAELLPPRMPRSRWGPEGNCGPAGWTDGVV